MFFLNYQEDIRVSQDQMVTDIAKWAKNKVLFLFQFLLFFKSIALKDLESKFSWSIRAQVSIYRSSKMGTYTQFFYCYGHYAQFCTAIVVLIMTK